MSFGSGKQIIINCIFVVGLLMSSFSAFTLLSDSNSYISVSATPVSGKVIVIDAGHGSPDGGATGYSGASEKDINLIIAKKTGDFLNKCGAQVIYTRESDNAISDNLNDTVAKIKSSDMKKRVYIRDSSNADIFISIHMNIFSDKRYKGAQVFYTASSENKELAESIQYSLRNILDKTNKREVIDAGRSIFVLNDSIIPSALIECGFISNPEEEKKLLSDSYQNKIAYAIGSGIIKYLNNTQGDAD